MQIVISSAPDDLFYIDILVYGVAKRYLVRIHTEVMSVPIAEIEQAFKEKYKYNTAQILNVTKVKDMVTVQ